MTININVFHENIIMILRWWISFSMSCCIVECINIQNLSRKVFRDACPCLPKDICPSILGSSNGDIDFFGKISTCPDKDFVKCCSASSNYIVAQRDTNISDKNAKEVSLDTTTTDNAFNSNEIENQYLEISSTGKTYSTTMTPIYEERIEWKTTEYDIPTEANKIYITQNIPDLEYSTLLSSNIAESTTELYEYPTPITPTDELNSISNNITYINGTQQSTTEILIQTTTEFDDVITSTTSMPKTTSFHDRRIRLREFLKKRLKTPITTTKRPVKTIQNIIGKERSYTSMTSNKKTNMRSVLYTNYRPRESFLKNKQQNSNEKSYSVKTSMINSDIQQTSPKIITSIPTEWSEISTPPTESNTHSTEIQNKIRKHFRGNKKYVTQIEW